jgi:ribose transport system ATP-binding protein
LPLQLWVTEKMLRFENISKSFSGVEVLHNISCSIEPGKIVALVGENGAGKSTLMKILSGVLTDHEGEISLKGRRLKFRNPKEAGQAGISIIHQELNLVPDLSVGENIFLGREPVSRFGRVAFRKLYRDSEQILEEFDFPHPPKQKVRTLAVGWQQMVEIAKALSINAGIIIMDEPTSALSEHEIAVLFEKIRFLKSRRKTVIFISHRLKEVFDIADEVIVLRDGNFVGKYPVKEVTREQLISLMIGREISDVASAGPLELQHEILRVEDLRVFRKGNPVLSGINFVLRKGEVLGVAGLLGAGRTELLKFLYGELNAGFSGRLLLNGKPLKPSSANCSIKNKIVYLPEDRKTEGIFAGQNLLFNSSISVLPEISAFGMVNHSEERRLVSEKFEELNVRMNSLSQLIPTLSGGNQQKVLLSRVLLLNPRLLLLDEPTRGIDVGAKEEIYELIERLSRRGISVMVTSSEIPELIRMCHRILVLSLGKQTAILTADQTNPQEILKLAFKQV